MKTSKLFLALALPMAFAACTNDDFTENNSQQVADGNLVELGDNFALAVQGASDAQTRGIWGAGEGTNFGWSWIPTLLSDPTEANNMLGTALGVASDEIGLCWTGELADGTGSLGQRVYTNYQFIHDGWLAEGEEEAKFNKCNFNLENGKRYSKVEVGTLNESSTLDQIKTQLTGDDNKVTINGTQKALNLNTGIFKTENKAIFGGSYIVYYPYNDQFAEAGYIPATGTVAFTDVVTTGTSVTSKDALAQRFVAENSFLVGYAKNLIGGSEASQFSLNQLSGIISLQMIGTTGISKTLTKVALYSKDGFVKNVGLDASKIATMGANGGTALYVDGTKETVSTIVADIAVSSQAALSSESKQIMYLPVLPTTAKDVEAILYAKDGTIARVAVADELTVAPAAGKSVIVKVSDSDFKDNVKIAVDEASLIAAVGSTAPAKATTIEVIGDIRLTDNLYVHNNLTISGDDIIVPAGPSLVVDASANNKPAAVFNSKVVIEGQGCCGTRFGKLLANGGTFNDIDNYGNVQIAGPVIVNGTLNNINDEEAEEDYSTRIAIRNNLGTESLTLNGTLVNKAPILNNNVITMNPDSKIINYSTITNAGMFFNNSSRANFENHNTYVDKLGYLLSGQLLTNVGEEAEYICEVDTDATRLNYALVQRSMVTTVRFVQRGYYDFSPYAGKNLTMKFDIVVPGDNVCFYGAKGSDNAVISVKSLTVSAGNLHINSNSVIDPITAKNNKLQLTVKEDLVIAENASFTIEQPILTSIDNSLTINGAFKVFTAGKVQVGNRTTENGKMYIGKVGSAVIAPNVQMNVYGNVDKAKEGQFTYEPATGTEVSGEVRCASYNTNAGWALGHAPILDTYFVF